ncbi:extracellular solute-binding protein [Nesterenkonia sp. LB17]|uniref:sugar ABC transporter substrate-binding protein n=1 Tax=Nesterenkonia sp. LB17 TaxID=2901230 RepID=UPI001F4D2A81|nr:extracellular solute-binding protein [Nesterenkonia sp. LB17]MCH8564397.1 extracellular solute-binding protein [Nesterenkonia sp. LB17]
MKNQKNRLAAPFAVGLASVLALTACGGDGFEDQETGGDAEEATSAEGSADLVMLIASSGEAETAAVEEAAAEWAEESGNEVEVRVAADMNQELAQGFAGGNPPDIFYLDAAQVAQQATDGNLHAYEAEDNEDYFPALQEAFTYEDTQWCAPKDFSTLGLQINTEMWEAAGLTDEDIPTTYEELAEVAETLTEGDTTGLVFSPGVDRVGAFVVGNGGWWLNEDATEPTGASEEVLSGLEYVKENMAEGSFAYAGDVDAGWGGEAFGTERAAMTIEGNWIRGAMSNDYPDVDYTVAELPEGSEGPGTLLFSQCWGVASDSEAQAEAVELVNHLSTPEQQLEFAEAFGVMPSRQAATEDYSSAFPEDAPFIAGGDYGRGPVNAPDMTQVVADLNSQLEGISSADLQQMMESFDSNASAVLEQ